MDKQGRMNAIAIVIAALALAATLLALFFGENIYQQIFGKSFYSGSELSNAFVTEVTPWSRNKLIYEETFEDGTISEIETVWGSFDIARQGDGNRVWRTENLGFSQIQLPTNSNDYAVQVRIMQVSGKGSFGHVQIRLEEGTPCNPDYEIYLDFLEGWLNLIERNSNCDEIRGQGLFDYTKFSLNKNVWYTIRIEAKDSEVRVYLDGKLMLMDRDIDGDIKNSNVIGFSVCCEDLGPAVFDFDDIRVWEISQ